MDKIPLIRSTTGLYPLNYQVGKTRILMKRDDLIDFAFGGNKVRMFEYIAAEVKKSGAKKIITFGSVHSNHVRVAAITADYLGISCDLIILQDGIKIQASDTLPPNLRLVKYCRDVHIVFCKTDEAHDFIDEYLSLQKDRAESYFWIPGGGHMPAAVYGYLDAAQEMKHQLDEITPDAVFLPCGTGTTMAGLLLGFSPEIPVYGVTVARPVEICRNVIAKLLSQIPNHFISEDMIHVLPSEIHYGEKNIEVNDIIGELVKSDGVHLDPVYNAKSFLKMTQFLKDHPEWNNVIYVNTGGIPNLFQ